MGKRIKFSLVTQEKIVYQNEVDQITIPTSTGVITVLPDHVPLISMVTPGELILKKDGELIEMAISSGILAVKTKSEVVVLAHETEFARDIDVKQAEEAYERARVLAKEKESAGDVDFARFQSLVETELNRLRIAKKYLRRKKTEI